MTGAITDAVMLVFSHLLAEFVLQPDSWLKKKKEEKHKSVIFILHALLAGALAYVFLAEWHAWYIIPAVAILHGVIDSWRMSRKTDNLTVFAIDQGLHLLSLAAVWLVFHSDLVTLPIQWSNSIWTNMVVHISAIIILTYPVGMVIGYFTCKICTAIKWDAQRSKDGRIHTHWYINEFFASHHSGYVGQEHFRK